MMSGASRSRSAFSGFDFGQEAIEYACILEKCWCNCAVSCLRCEGIWGARRGHAWLRNLEAQLSVILEVQVTYITLGICLATWLAISGLMLSLASVLPMTAALPSKHRAAVASLAGTLMMARSPASMVCSSTKPQPVHLARAFIIITMQISQAELAGHGVSFTLAVHLLSMTAWCRWQC